jgi:hypothetical protein
MIASNADVGSNRSECKKECKNQGVMGLQRCDFDGPSTLEFVTTREIGKV